VVTTEAEEVVEAVEADKIAKKKIQIEPNKQNGKKKKVEPTPTTNKKITVEPRSNKSNKPDQKNKRVWKPDQKNKQNGTKNETKKSNGQKRTSKKKRKSLYSDYISQRDVTEGVRAGTIVIGELSVFKFPHVAFVKMESCRDIVVSGHANINRAFHGDIVAAEILPPKEKEEKEEDTDGEDEEDTDEEISIEEESVEEEKEPKRYGKIVRIMKSNCPEEFLGAVSGRLFHPSQERFPRLILDKSDEAFDGKFVKCRVKKWADTMRNPYGVVKEVVGDIDKFDTQYTALKLKNNVTHSETFDESVFADLPLSGWKIPEDEIARRSDLRNELIFSIDPPTAKDLDDALSCVKLPNGNFRVGVHIADVSFFVKENSPLDLEARDRGNTVYFVCENTPMLPRILCDELCSLHGNVDRLAFSVIWELTPEGKKINEEFVRSVICTRGQYDYATAHDMILHPENYEADPDMHECAEAVNNLNNIAVKLREDRYLNGSISLDNAEIHFDFDEDQNITGVRPYERYDSHFLVEEFMLLANISVAEKLFNSMTEGSLLRWHPKPDDKKLDEFVQQCELLGLKVDITNSQTLHESIQKISQDFNGITMDAILYLASQPMKSALYTASSVDSVENAYHHYALNFPLYTHFTSPIRRYPDLIVHRQLGAIISGEQQTMTYDFVAKICTNCNERKREADYASRDCRRLYLNQYLRTRRFIEKGIVVEVSTSRVTILVPDYDIRDCINLSDSKLYKLKYMKASKTLNVMFKDEKLEESECPSVDLKLLSIVDVEMLYTSANFCHTISLRLAKPGDREIIEKENAHKE